MEAIERSLSGLVSLYKREKAKSASVELEVSLGKIDKLTGKFVSGCDFSHFEKLLLSMRNSEEKTWSGTNTSHFQTFYFDSGLRARYFADGRPPEFIRKKKISHVDISLFEVGVVARVSLSSETSASKNEAGNTTIQSVRLQERFTFVRKNRWSYDLSKVGCGASKQAACEAKPTFEIEIEVVDLPKSEEAAQTAKHIALKIMDIGGCKDARLM
jgi:hypothetical protein